MKNRTDKTVVSTTVVPTGYIHKYIKPVILMDEGSTFDVMTTVKQARSILADLCFVVVMSSRAYVMQQPTSPTEMADEWVNSLTCEEVRRYLDQIMASGYVIVYRFSHGRFEVC